MVIITYNYHKCRNKPTYIIVNNVTMCQFNENEKSKRNCTVQHLPAVLRVFSLFVYIVFFEKLINGVNAIKVLPYHIILTALRSLRDLDPLSNCAVLVL